MTEEKKALGRKVREKFRSRRVLKPWGLRNDVTGKGQKSYQNGRDF